jgi:hypothetical protein
VAAKELPVASMPDYFIKKNRPRRTGRVSDGKIYATGVAWSFGPIQLGLAEHRV